MRLIRVFVSSPGDCTAERTALDEAVERINRSESDRTQTLLRTFAWERDVVPQIGPPPQAVVDDQTPPCDIYVGIMSARFGGDGTRESGTEQEFRAALKQFGDQGKPWILFYFNDQPAIPSKPDAIREWLQVNELRQELEKSDIVGTFAGTRGTAKGFFETIELHLRQVLQRPELHAADLKSTKKAVNSTSPSRKPPVPPQYLAWLQRRCAGVDLFGLEPKYGSAARLQSIYVPLTTTPGAEPTPKKRLSDTPARDVDPVWREPTLLLARLAAGSLYAPGAPGAGKSTFCRWVTWLACEGRLPTTSLVEPPDGYRERWPAVFKNRLPLLVKLRECWQSLPARPGSRDLSRQAFEESLADWLASNSEGLDAGTVHTHVAAGSALVILDGVDEVPITHGNGQAQCFPRAALISALANTLPVWTEAGNRILVTSRPYGLGAADVTALGLPEARLLDLDAPLRELLIERWFQQLRPGDEGRSYAADLSAHVAEHAWLEPLAANPLLLTGMCIVFDEGKRLPQDKHDLYSRIVGTVLHSRYRDDVKGRETALYRLQAVAYGMHTGHGLNEARTTPEAEASYRDVDRILRAYLDTSSSKEEGKVATVVAREELLSQSGLFLGRGDQKTGFFHLSFQEFFAGQRLADVEDDLLAVFLERSAVQEWHNTLSLLFASLTRERAARLVGGMAERFDTHGPRLHGVAADCLDILLARGARVDALTEQMCRQTFLSTMVSGAPAILRCRVGSTVGRLGDPRFHDERRFCLPRDQMLGFVEIEAGEFVMGNDKTDPGSFDDEQPVHRLTLPTFLVARYPVTVAQFAAFAVAAKVNGYEPADPRCLRGLPNHPVAYVTWHDALAYCRWLDASLRVSLDTPSDLRSALEGGDHVTLPSEAEWERAARGRGRRRYPWGAELEPDCANTIESEVGTTSPVGAFPRGATPPEEGGVQDLSGNVWEWTRSQYRPYPYRLDDGRENLTAGDDIVRVVRGGSFDYVDHLARAASRYWFNPVNRYDVLGFRVVVSCSGS